MAAIQNVTYFKASFDFLRFSISIMSFRSSCAENCFDRS